MAKQRSVKPTDGELEILQVIWTLQTATVRDVHDELSKTREIAQTSIATMMQLMTKKGLLTIIDDRRPQKYAPTSDSGDTKDALIGHLVKKAFNGSAKRLVMHLFQGKKTSPEQLAEVEKLLEELD